MATEPNLAESGVRIDVNCVQGVLQASSEDGESIRNLAAHRKAARGATGRMRPQKQQCTNHVRRINEVLTDPQEVLIDSLKNLKSRVLMNEGRECVVKGLVKKPG